jgi:hypothetical protein
VEIAVKRTGSRKGPEFIVYEFKKQVHADVLKWKLAAFSCLGTSSCSKRGLVVAAELRNRQLPYLSLEY